MDYHIRGFNVIKRRQRKREKRKSKEEYSNNKDHPHPPSGREEFDRKLIENRIKHAQNARIEYAQKLDQRGISIREQNIEKIKYCLSNSLDGLTTTQLSKQTGIHRRMIFGICKELMEDDLVMKGKGKRGKYHLTPKALSTDSFVSVMFWT
jgi:predicted transcriptional regulator